MAKYKCNVCGYVYDEGGREGTVLLTDTVSGLRDGEVLFFSSCCG